MKPESKLWQMVRKNLPDIHWTRLESWAMPGVPDCYGILEGTSVFVELKVTKSNKINLSPFQKSWNFTHSLKGGRSFIMATTLEESLLYIFPGILAPSIASITNCPSPNWQVKAGPASWSVVREVLLHSPLPKPSPPEA